MKSPLSEWNDLQKWTERRAAEALQPDLAGRVLARARTEDRRARLRSLSLATLAVAALAFEAAASFYYSRAAATASTQAQQEEFSDARQQLLSSL
jgi:hypothetical protein